MKYIVIIFIFSSSVMVSCKSRFLTEKQNLQDTIRVACVGNSITYGARLADPEKDSYPAKLQRMFGQDNVLVKNFGISSATIIRFGRPNHWQQLEKIKSWLPQVVIIISGTNETVSGERHNWEHISDFENDYYDFLTQLKALDSHPVIYICSPTDMVLKTPGLSKDRLKDLSLRRPRLWELRKRIRKISNESEVHFIDLSPDFKNKPELFTPEDGVHPNSIGYNFLAKVIFENIKKTVNRMSLK